MKKLFLFLMIAASLFACQTPTKPAFDLANAKKEIEAANLAITEFVAKGDSVGLASAYTPEGSLMLSNIPSIKGKDKLISFWSSFTQSGAKITLTTLEVWGDENFIAEEGLLEIKTKEGAQIDKGKFIVLWKKEGGKWKVHRDMSNSDLPATAQ
jgi:ketosteroid isomerase-like protein